MAEDTNELSFALSLRSRLIKERAAEKKKRLKEEGRQPKAAPPTRAEDTTTNTAPTTVRIRSPTFEGAELAQTWRTTGESMAGDSMGQSSHGITLASVATAAEKSVERCGHAAEALTPCATQLDRSGPGAQAIATLAASASALRVPPDALPPDAPTCGQGAPLAPAQAQAQTRIPPLLPALPPGMPPGLLPLPGLLATAAPPQAAHTPPLKPQPEHVRYSYDTQDREAAARGSKHDRQWQSVPASTAPSKDKGPPRPSARPAARPVAALPRDWATVRTVPRCS